MVNKAFLIARDRLRDPVNGGYHMTRSCERGMSLLNGIQSSKLNRGDRSTSDLILWGYYIDRIAETGELFARPRILVIYGLTMANRKGQKMKKEIRLNFSEGNTKTGLIRSVSLPPVITCDKNLPCYKACYARKNQRYPNVKKSYAENLEYYKENPDGFFADLERLFKISGWFRMHVGGDIPDPEYFKRLVKASENAPKCDILIFTKKAWIINGYIADGGRIPKNLHIIFSAWLDWKPENPYNFPMTNIFVDPSELPKKAIVCGGNCENCICSGVGCWQLKKGQTLYFKKH